MSLSVNRQAVGFLAAAFVAVAAVIPGALAASERVGNFTLIDQHGKAVELHYYNTAPALVLMAHRNDSALVKASAEKLAQVQEQHPDVEIFLINAVEEETRSAVLQNTQQQGLDFSVLVDNSLLVPESLNFSYAGEVLVLDTHRWEVLYRGPVSSDPSSARVPNLVADVLDEHLAGQPLSVTSHGMPAAFAGEALTLPDLASRDAEISYSETIAPVLKQKCADCHRPGGIAPWAMTGHTMVQGFSPMIRETVLTKRMPPWHADPEVNSFKHDLSLTVEETRDLVHWIDAGAPRGTGNDPLAEVRPMETVWELGEPDLIVDLPAFEIPATGTLRYQFFEVENPLDHDVWVKAVQIVPGDRQVVHHAIATFGAPSAGGRDSSLTFFQPQLMTFVPGNETYIYPEDTGVFIPAGTSFFTQMHYTTYGRETIDQTRIGLYFSEEAPEHVLQHYAIVGLDLQIPAGEAEHQESAYYQFQRDAVIYSLFPHAHYRGRSSEFTLRYPDGREELVLSVPNYDFNWQRYFQFEDPINVPAGTLVIHSTVYDNSAANLSNPDPELLVRFGEQTWEEMLYGGISFRYADPRENDFEIDQVEYLTSIAMGFLDKNMDGKVELSEMPEGARDALALPFVLLDQSKTGGLEFDEFRRLMEQDSGRMLRSRL